MPSQKAILFSTVVALFVSSLTQAKLSTNLKALFTRDNKPSGEKLETFLSLGLINPSAYYLQDSDMILIKEISDSAYELRHNLQHDFPTYNHQSFLNSYVIFANGTFSSQSQFQEWAHALLKDLEQQTNDERQGLMNKTNIHEQNQTNETGYDFYSSSNETEYGVQGYDYDWTLSESEKEDIHSLVESLATYDNTIKIEEVYADIISKVQNCSSKQEYFEVYNQITAHYWESYYERINKTNEKQAVPQPQQNQTIDEGKNQRHHKHQDKHQDGKEFRGDRPPKDHQKGKKDGKFFFRRPHHKGFLGGN
ncbi:UNKNOWN [Stylonychia lemnae]|uniref:Uncharacterized protein n=1 Tax=Stylonychia lemnae TaxID=5949 RepID=A0A078B306_STYLE|nr:UNKNOWN [Stylonychia lemnae]|eukprot:CDW88646.1 UNKNOWN [Stylonychia lemnae]